MAASGPAAALVAEAFGDRQVLHASLGVPGVGLLTPLSLVAPSGIRSRDPVLSVFIRS
jgi:hypothetical protein